MHAALCIVVIKYRVYFHFHTLDIDCRRNYIEMADRDSTDQIGRAVGIDAEKLSRVLVECYGDILGNAVADRA